MFNKTIHSGNILPTLLFLIFVLHSTYQISTFGIEQGTYFWFCNLALFLGSFFIYFQRKDLLLVLLSVLAPTQSLWILDHFKRSMTGTDFFGLTEALYHPGVSTVGFLIGHYHYFLVPILLFTFFSLPERTSSPFKNLCVLAASIIPLSYFLFPEEQNINCTRISCLETFPTLEGRSYVLLFSPIIFAVCYGVATLLKQSIMRLAVSQKANRNMLLILTGLGIALTSVGYARKQSIPRFACKPPYEDEKLKIGCDFLTEHLPDWMVLHYKVVNKTSAIQECESYIEFEGKKELFQNGLTVPANEDLKVSILIHYPIKNTAIQLSAVCQPL